MDAIKEEKRKAEVLEEEQRMGNSPEETEQATATSAATSSCRRKRMTGYTSRNPYHEDRSDSEKVDDEDE